MKKLCALWTVLLLLTLTGCGGRGDGVVRTITDTGDFTAEEVNAAMDVVMAQFKKQFDGGTLREIYYDGKVFDEESPQVMTLRVDFLPGEKRLVAGTMADVPVSRWWWHLEKNEKENWVVKSYGPGV